MPFHHECNADHNASSPPRIAATIVAAIGRALDVEQVREHAQALAVGLRARRREPARHQNGSSSWRDRLSELDAGWGIRANDHVVGNVNACE
jgi:hypothetical protein